VVIIGVIVVVCVVVVTGVMVGLLDEMVVLAVDDVEAVVEVLECDEVSPWCSLFIVIGCV